MQHYRTQASVILIPSVLRHLPPALPVVSKRSRSLTPTSLKTRHSHSDNTTNNCVARLVHSFIHSLVPSFLLPFSICFLPILVTTKRRSHLADPHQTALRNDPEHITKWPTLRRPAWIPPCSSCHSRIPQALPEETADSTISMSSTMYAPARADLVLPCYLLIPAGRRCRVDAHIHSTSAAHDSRCRFLLLWSCT